MVVKNEYQFGIKNESEMSQKWVSESKMSQKW